MHSRRSIHRFRDTTGETKNVRSQFNAVIGSLVLLLIFATNSASAQSLQDISGAWKLVSAVHEQQGKKVDMYGAHPRGVLMIEANGRYVTVIARANLPKIASNNRTTATAEENNAIVDGSMAHFGTVTVDSTNHTLDFRIETSTYANWDGIEQKRAFKVEGDELRYTNSSGTTGSATELVWKRIP
jgi:hypothetical protein